MSVLTPTFRITAGRAQRALVCVFVFFFAFSFFCSLPAAQASSPALSKGRASWYGTTAHGKKTANGEIYNREALTAAHKSIPFGTVLRVFNLKNGRHVLVRVNDRGPFVEGREVDVSLRAAESLRMIRAGVASVAIQVISDKKGRPLDKNNAFYIHLTNDEGLLSSRVLAAELATRTGLPVRALRFTRGSYQGYAVLAGPFSRFSEAQKTFLRLENKDMAVIGIVEGPLVGNTLPAFDATKRRTAQNRPEDNTVLGTLLRGLHQPFKASTIPGTEDLLPPITKYFLPGLAGGPLLLSPSAPLSAYISSL